MFAEQHQRFHAGQKFRHHAFGLRAGVSRVKRRKLDGNAWPAVDTATGRGLADGVNGVFIILIIALGIPGGGRRLAQHVIGILKAMLLQRLRPLDRFADRFARHELFAHHAHGHVDAAADNGFAGPGNQLRQSGRQPAVVDGRGELSGNDKAPGGCIDEERAPSADMGLPVTAGDLVADQCIAGSGVWNAQQCLGKAHQRHTFMA